MTLDGLPFDRNDLETVFTQKYGHYSQLGWGPRLRHSFGYYQPDDIYETLLYRMVDTNTIWLDVGCGRNIFPQNAGLAQVLSDRCQLLVGVDPDETIWENTFVHEKYQCKIEEFKTKHLFDIVSMRMVAEHISEPPRVVENISVLLKSGGKIIIYTVNKRSPISRLAKLLPFFTHHFLKSYFWQSEEKDTFPVAYKMNTRRELQELFSDKFRQISFCYLEDCRVFGRFRRLNYCELAVRALFSKLGVVYPENCLLAVYERY